MDKVLDPMTNLNLTYNECFQTMRNFGDTTFYNICDPSSQVHVVPWGLLDWVSNIGILTLEAAITTALLGVAGVISYAIFEEATAYSSWRTKTPSKK